MSVDVGIGRAIYEITNTNLAAGKTYKVYHDNDAVQNVLITAADATHPRIDIIVMKCDVSQDPDASAGNIPSIITVAGTPAGSPSAPATPANCLKIGQIAVAAGATSITTGNITDSRTYVTISSSVLLDLQREATAIKTTRAQFADFTTKTISSGAIVVTQPLHLVDTEASASTDDLDTITAAYGAGELIHLRAASTARTIVIKHNTGNIKLADAADFSIDDTEKSITLIRVGSTWQEVCRGIGSPTTSTTSKVVYSSGANSTGIGSGSTSIIDFDTHTYPIPANDLVNGVEYEFEVEVLYAKGAGTGSTYVTLGTTNCAFATTTTANGEYAVLRGKVRGTAAAGAAAAVKTSISSITGPTSPNSSGGARSDNLATNGTLALKFSHAFGTNNGSNLATLTGVTITKKSATPFT